MDDGKNCRNCGAPLNEHGDCEYCGTKSPREQECLSHLELSADALRITTMCAADLQKMVDRCKILAGYGLID